MGRSRFLGALLLLVWCMCAATTAAWWLFSAGGDWRPWLGLSALLGAGAVMAHGWQRSPIGQLRWDGRHWAWESPVYQGGSTLEAPQVVLDLQSAVLIRLSNPAGASWWLWAERGLDLSRWLDLRRAIYARPRPEHATDILASAPVSTEDTAKVGSCDPATPISPR